MSEENSEGSSEYINSTSSRYRGYEYDEARDNSFEQSEEVEELYYEWLGHDEEDAKKAQTMEREGGEEGTEEPSSASQRRGTLRGLDSRSSITLTSKVSAEARDAEEGSAEVLERYSESLGVEGVARIELSALSQRILGCTVGADVTTEYPWIEVRKEVIEDDIDLHSESSDFLPIGEEVRNYPGHRMLLGYTVPKAKTRVKAKAAEGAAQFYVCLTEESREAVSRRIEALRREQQLRVRGAVHKEPSQWRHLGSAQAVDESFVKRARPLYEIEVQSTVHQLRAPMILTDRSCEDQRDGYVEIMPYRESFDNVRRSLVDKACTVVPTIAEAQAQTPTSMPANAWCHCALDREATGEFSLGGPKAEKNLQGFVESRASHVGKEIAANATWDVHANDYEKLAETATATATTTTTTSTTAAEAGCYTESQCYYEGKLCGGRLINDLAWHPQWTGLLAAAYTRVAKSENLIGPKPHFVENSEGTNQVLIWSFDDCLQPKLILESHRQVTSVSFCPRNGNILIGGCMNGQIVVWDMSGRIEARERTVSRSATEAKHASVVRSLGAWMREPSDARLVRPAACSALQEGPRGAITRIEWLPAHGKLNDRGRFVELDGDAAEDELSLQFVTSSEDGSVTFWDLSWRPPPEKKTVARPRGKKRAVEKPESLARATSVYKVLDGVFKPLYILMVQQATETRNAVVTAMSLRAPELPRQQVEPFPRPDDDATVRRYYRVLAEKREENVRPAGIFIGTASGECGLISWEGYDFSTGVALNKEVCKWTWRKQVHDGPVSHAVRSRHLKDLLLTVGGKVFAVWREDFGEPLLWRKSEFRYTACCWDAGKPTVIILGRNDGTIEIWDVFIKSHEPNITQSLSGRIITGIYAHELPLNPRCVGFCDYNGALRIFRAPQVSFAFGGESDVKWMRQFVDREVNRIKDFIEWQKKWNEMNADYSEEPTKPSEEEDVKKSSETVGKLKEESAKVEAAKNAKKKERKRLVDELRARWVGRELQRMQRTILEKKGLHGEELERRRAPVLRMQREARDKEARRGAARDAADDVFGDALTKNFTQEASRAWLATAKGETTQRTADQRSSVYTLGAADNDKADEDIIREFADLESEALLSMRRLSREMDFSWRRLINEGLKRRRSMDVNLKVRKAKPYPDERSESRGSERAASLASSLETFRDPDDFPG